MTGTRRPDPGWSRRRFLGGAGATALALAAGCGSPTGPAPVASPSTNSTTTTTTLSPARRPGIPDPVDHRVTRWGADPWSRGSYSYLPAGSSARQRLDLARPVGSRVVMAGEATEPDYPASVHGAVRSGARAAGEVLELGAGSCVVVGAGAAGIEAARTLREAGIDVVVVEARDRIGGRVWTDDLDGTPLDLGASWLHGLYHNDLEPWARRLGIELVHTNYEDAVLFDTDGSPLAWRRLDHLYAAVEDAALSSSSTRAMGPELDRVRAGLTSEEQPWFDYVVVSEIEHWWPAHVDDLAMATAWEGAPSVGGDFVPTTGYLPILEAMADGVEFHLGQAVTGIRHDDRGVTVVSDRQTLEAEAAVVTLPLGVLQSGTVSITPEPSHSHRAAVAGLGMGLMNKVVLRFDEPFWDTDVDLIGYVPADRGRFVEWYNAVPWTGQPILVGFNTARAATDLEARPDGEVVDLAMADLATMYA